jgi:hypothetical protein
MKTTMQSGATNGMFLLNNYSESTADQGTMIESMIESILEPIIFKC